MYEWVDELEWSGECPGSDAHLADLLRRSCDPPLTHRFDSPIRFLTAELRALCGERIAASLDVFRAAKVRLPALLAQLHEEDEARGYNEADNDGRREEENSSSSQEGFSEEDCGPRGGG